MPKFSNTTRSRTDDDRVLRIVQTTTDQSMRSLTGRKVIGSASLFLLKSASAFFTEGSNELMAAKRLEFMTNVVRTKAQPCRIDMVIDGKLCSYTPDIALLFDTGERAIWEIKPDWSHLEDTDYIRKLELAREALVACGWGFETKVRFHFDDKTAASRIINDNVNLMFCSRMLVVTEGQRARVNVLLRDAEGLVTLDQVCDAIGGDPRNATGCAFAMMARRLIDIDITRKLTGASIVRPVKALPAYLPPLRF